MDKTIRLNNFDGCTAQRDAKVQFCTHNTLSHMNIYITDHRGKGSYLCVSPEDAAALRDALIEAYPLPAPEKECAEPVKNGKRRPHGKQEYKGNGKHDWEDVTEDGSVKRLRVPGGWLYGDRLECTVAFVPVPDVVGYAV